MSLDDDGAPAIVQRAAITLPAGRATVGGDFKLVWSDESRTVALVGDVEGNGTDAAPYAERLCQEVRRNAACADPVELLERLNSYVHGDPRFDRFVTACVLVIDCVCWSAEWAYAGHLPPHWLDTGLPLDGATPGVPLGVDTSCGATSAQRRPLRPGEGVLLFTDGLEDVKGPGGDRFGSARVTHTLARRLNGASVDDVVRVLRDVACEFGQNQLPDDLCLVALRAT
jgi:sigma-B regulation protein RsbU (phosphoserine phosphatase)